ncbi:hypothetical protein [Kitasatospora sp. GAS1066B]|uniref:hypothetical protein n=1 Tax=Kitasatospora sp. GAS1066B TaxID=3156271 RepID=UPI0035146CA1
MHETAAVALQLAVDGSGVPYPETITKPVRPARRRDKAEDRATTEPCDVPGQLDGLAAIAALA